MKDIKIVIGANYGDEGKGLMTDYFVHKAVSEGKSVCTVLSNGGPQRGHTVRSPKQGKHVFHHFGSGTFVTNTTYIPKQFIVNPILFAREGLKLSGNFGIKPIVFVHPDCWFTTPYDMLANQHIENFRNKNRHGSVGLGIWETEVRYTTTPLTLSISKFLTLNRKQRHEYLDECKNNLYKRVLSQTDMNLDLRRNCTSYIFDKPSTIDKLFLDDVDYFQQNIIFNPEGILSTFDSIVFENGQGLRLSRNNIEEGNHTTPSYTGLKNPIEIINQFTFKANVEACYVTRSYLTRHGAGPLPRECKSYSINKAIFDETNTYNDYQGSIRYAKLDTDEMMYHINNDYSNRDMHGFHHWKKSLAVTHTNEYQLHLGDYGFDKLYLSDSDTRESVQLVVDN